LLFVVGSWYEVVSRFASVLNECYGLQHGNCEVDGLGSATVWVFTGFIRKRAEVKCPIITASYSPGIAGLCSVQTERETSP